MFPKHSHNNVEQGYAHVESAFNDYLARTGTKLTEQDRLTLRLYMYATVAAETGNFTPAVEQPNRTNTSHPLLPEFRRPGDVVPPFNTYAFRNGNEGINDAQTYRGRGYVQITGKKNYAYYGVAAGLHDLPHNPNKAAEPKNAAALLVAYVMEAEKGGHNNRARILNALNKGDMIAAREVVNGSNHHHLPNGLDNFVNAYAKGLKTTHPNTDRAVKELQHKEGTQQAVLKRGTQS